MEPTTRRWIHPSRGRRRLPAAPCRRCQLPTQRTNVCHLALTPFHVRYKVLTFRNVSVDVISVEIFASGSHSVIMVRFAPFGHHTTKLSNSLTNTYVDPHSYRSPLLSCSPRASHLSTWEAFAFNRSIAPSNKPPRRVHGRPKSIHDDGVARRC
jgi:hypothetical protein